MTEPESEQTPIYTPLSWRQTPLAKVLASQFIAMVIAFGGSLSATYLTGEIVPVAIVLIVQGLLAAWIGNRFELAKWWIPVQIFLPPAAALAATFDMPAWIYPVVFFALLLVYWNSARNRVPLYLTNRTTWTALAQLLAPEDEQAFLDIGSGIGGALFYLARNRPNINFTGIESAPLPFALSWLRWKLSGSGNVTLKYGDFWKLDLGEFDTVYAFLSPEPMPKLYCKAQAELRDGALLISNSFAVPEVPADETLTVNDRRRTQLHLWRMGELEQESGGQSEENIKAYDIGDGGQKGA